MKNTNSCYGIVKNVAALPTKHYSYLMSFWNVSVDFCLASWWCHGNPDTWRHDSRIWNLKQSGENEWPPKWNEIITLKIHKWISHTQRNNVCIFVTSTQNQYTDEKEWKAFRSISHTRSRTFKSHFLSGFFSICLFFLIRKYLFIKLSTNTKSQTHKIPNRWYVCEESEKIFGNLHRVTMKVWHGHSSKEKIWSTIE